MCHHLDLSAKLLILTCKILAPLQAFIAYPSLLNSLVPGYSPWADISMLIHSPAADIGSKGVARISNSGIDGIRSLSRTISSSELSKQGKPGSLFHGIPDFAEVYSFMGSVFDPDTQGRVQKLKEMDPINFEIVIRRVTRLETSSLDRFVPANLCASREGSRSLFVVKFRGLCS
ncbi:unnamed protein product [Camellia sinensis]